jgi:hypothetical protein
MKTLKKLRLGSLMLLLLLAMGCSLQDEEPLKIADESSDDVTAKIANLRQVSKDGPIYLSGFQKYYTYAVKSKEIIQGKDDEGLPCDVIIEFLEAHEIRITVDEGRPDGPGVYLGTMTPSGQVKFSFPSPLMILPDDSPFYITDIISMHSGCELYGPGINKGTLNYHGYFDGERLLVSASFYSKCEVEWPLNDLFETPVEGPVHWKWTIDVTVD